MQHVHTWRAEEVRVGLNARERASWEQYADLDVRRLRLFYKYCACGAVLL